MSGLMLFDIAVTSPDLGGAVIPITVFMAPVNAAASISLRAYTSDVDAPEVILVGQVLSITHRNDDGSDTPIPTTPPPISSTASTGVAFDPAMSSVTWRVTAIASAGQWVGQIYIFRPMA
jgi:hypothetical protein